MPAAADPSIRKFVLASGLRPGVRRMWRPRRGARGAGRPLVSNRAWFITTMTGVGQNGTPAATFGSAMSSDSRDRAQLGDGAREGAQVVVCEGGGRGAERLDGLLPTQVSSIPTTEPLSRLELRPDHERR